MNSEWLKDCFRLQLRILTFRASQDELFNLGWRQVPFGLFWALLAGVGRAWDNANASLFFHSGLPSLIYVFALSLFLWIFIAALRPQQWRLSRVIAFVSLTAMPGILYAVPLEMMLSPDDAIVGNGILLLIVAAWRVALLTIFVRKSNLSGWGTATAVCLPLSLIILGLVWTDRLEKTFSVMGGFRYYVVDNESLAKPHLEEHVALPNFSGGSYDKLHTRGAKGTHTVYREFSHNMGSPIGSNAPPGMREVTWDDPEYMPPTPVIAAARALHIASLIAAPIFVLSYLITWWTNSLDSYAQWSMKRRASRALAADKSAGEPGIQEPADDSSAGSGD